MTTITVLVILFLVVLFIAGFRVVFAKKNFGSQDTMLIIKTTVPAI